MEVDLEWLKIILIKELRERGEFFDMIDKVVILREIFVFFVVSSMDVWYEVWMNDDVVVCWF